MVLGDLNEIIFETKKFGEREIWRKKLFLREFMQNLGGIDLGFNGSRFVWDNNQEGAALIKERLDRAVVNELWMENFPAAAVFQLLREEYDHSPILVTTVRSEGRRNRPFRFIEAWISNDSSKVLIKEVWNSDYKGGMHGHRLNRSLRATTIALQKWNREVFGFANIKVKDLEKELEELQGIDSNRGWHNQIHEKLRTQRYRLDSINRRKSRKLWLKAGAKILSFFT